MKENKIALLYLCSGEYSILWNDYYISFMGKFLPDIEKDFYVFTDASSLPYMNNDNVFIYNNPYVGWPVASLKRFELFLSVKDELLYKGYSYVFFCNANLRCLHTVNPQDIGIGDENVRLIAARHPAYEFKRKWRFPYDRNPKTTAYIPYNCGQYYVMGSFNGGRTRDYLDMAEELDHNESIDAANGVTPKVFDESYLNRFIAERDYNGVKILSSAYCGSYPMPLENVYLMMAKKSDYFDEDKIKSRKKYTKFYVLFEKGIRFSYSFIHYVIDSVKRKSIVPKQIYQSGDDNEGDK